MYFSPVEDLALSRIRELRAEARREIQARLARCPRSLSDALNSLRARVGGVMISIGRRIAPRDVSAGAAAGGLDRC